MWGSQEELGAIQAELLDKLWRQTVAINSKKGSQQPKPIQIPRPWQLRKKQRQKTTREKRSATLAEIGNFLQGR